MTGDPGKRIIFPLDVSTEAEAWQWCLKLRGRIGVTKVGLELFTSHGPSILSAPKGNGFGIFLDLKLHDIPNTVGKAAEAAARHEVQFLSVHASGGSEMMKAAVEGAGDGCMILAITALTSLGESDLRAIYGQNAAQDVTLNLATIAYEAGARGFVCSPLEVKLLRDRLGPDVKLVVPGVRPQGADVNDQKRVATPKEAIKDGADFLVIGRPIRNASNLDSALAGIGCEIAEGLRS